jgi:hypothetical protein
MSTAFLIHDLSVSSLNPELLIRFLFSRFSVLNWVLLESDSPNGSRSEREQLVNGKKAKSAPVASPVRLVNYYDLLLVQFFLSLAALTYRSNFTLILEDTFHLEAHIIGEININLFVTSIIFRVETDCEQVLKHELMFLFTLVEKYKYGKIN